MSPVSGHVDALDHSRPEQRGHSEVHSIRHAVCGAGTFMAVNELHGHIATTGEGTDRLGGEVDLDALVAYFEANSPVPPGPQDRINVENN